MRIRNVLFILGVAAAWILPALPAFASRTDDDSDDSGKKTVRKIVINNGGGFLGVGVADIDSDRASELKLKDDYGVEITSVVDGSPASKAGLKEEDVVLEYNGERLESTTQFVRKVRETPPGREVKLLISRDGRTMTLTPTIDKQKVHVYRMRSHGNRDSEGSDNDNDNDNDSNEGQWYEAPDGSDVYSFEMPEINIPEIHIPDIPSTTFMWNTPRLGVETESLSPQLAEFFGVKKGLLIRSVIKDSAAERAGLRAGDIITKVGDTDVSRQGQVSDALRSLPSGESFPISIVRNKREMNITAKLDERKPLKQKHERPRARLFSSEGGDEL